MEDKFVNDVVLVCDKVYMRLGVIYLNILDTHGRVRKVSQLHLLD